jgi:acetylornithine deacetylase
MIDMRDAEIMKSVDVLFERQIAFLSELVRHASTRGREQSAQDFMARELKGLGYEVDRWLIDVNDIQALPGFSPVIGNYDNAVNVVGSLRCSARRGRSLILNGHIDVVPVGPLDMWERDPFDPHVDGDWMYGRGSGDMKAGLTSNIFAVEALRRLGLRPGADLFLQSVVEEECTGNGALACLQRGYRADAALITEPFAETLVSSQVGVLWFQVHLKGIPAHVAYAGSGSNAIEAAIPLIEALHAVEQRMNAEACRHHDYATHEHALNLNIGKIQGGDWASSVPAWCVFDVRMGVFPGQDLGAARAMIESALREAAQTHPFLVKNAPEIMYNGFLAEGYSFVDDKSAAAADALAALTRAHTRVTGTPLKQEPITATTDARFFGLYAETPALVYGPRAEAIHGFNERVDLESLRRVTQSTALFIAEWCGLDQV